MDNRLAEIRKRYPTVFGAYEITKVLGSGAHGTVYKIERSENEHTLSSALKIISVPQSDSEINERRAEGYSDASISSYYKEVAGEIAGEVYLLSKVKGNSYIVTYEDHQLVAHPDGIGWDIIIRMEFLTPLKDYYINKPFSAFDVLKLGMDMCHALSSCAKHNIIHRDIKPENIFVSDEGNFKLGDFGVARTCEKIQLGLSKKGTYNYMAPEVYRGEDYSANVDIYSLGMVLYRYINGNRMPFLSGVSAPTYNQELDAVNRRMRGEPLPEPRYISASPPAPGELNTAGMLVGVILTACSPNPADRYSTPERMLNELERIKVSINSPSAVPPPGRNVSPAPGTTGNIHGGTPTPLKITPLNAPSFDMTVAVNPLSPEAYRGDENSQSVQKTAPEVPELKPEQNISLSVSQQVTSILKPPAKPSGAGTGENVFNQSLSGQSANQGKNGPAAAPGQQAPASRRPAPLPLDEVPASGNKKEKSGGFSKLKVVIITLAAVFIVLGIIIAAFIISLSGAGRKTGGEPSAQSSPIESSTLPESTTVPASSIQSTTVPDSSVADESSQTDRQATTTKADNDTPRTTVRRTNPPVTSPPVTSPPVTNPPQTSPPVTSPPQTSPPRTNPPQTSPPRVDDTSNMAQGRE